MVKKTSSETVPRVFALRQLQMSYDKIVQALFASQISVSRNTVISIIKENKRLHEGVRVDLRKFGIQNGRTARTAGLIRKVAAACSKENPPTQRYLASRHGVSAGIINRTLAEDLAWNMRKKRKTRHLIDKQAAQRLERGPGFLRCLGKYKSRMIFTMDETFVSLSIFNKERDIYYQAMEVVVPPTWEKKSMEAWPRKIMVAMGICWEGTSRLYIVPEKSKVNAAYFIKYILRPMVEIDIPRLYERAKDVWLHMDSAPAHTAAETIQWLEGRQIKLLLRTNGWPIRRIWLHLIMESIKFKKIDFHQTCHYCRWNEESH